AGMSLGRLPLDRLELILHVWADRYRIHRADPRLKYVLPFENRGVEMGVTLHHPHGQIYAYPFVPSVPRLLGEAQHEHWRLEREGLLRSLLLRERHEKVRLIYDGEFAGAVLPACARYPYEIWIAPWEIKPSLEDLRADETRDLARALKTVLLKYDGLWKKPMPYLLLLYAAPIDGEPHPEWHFHIQIRPALRTENRLKYLAGTELGAGVFVNDSLPEEKARELQGVEVRVD
ncbi:MAG TPA: hypothetical protein PL182_12620, partial [Pseudobdellovibrionaceae bacterium]|nr:hypothetical protein [Pseudobdellovibrionaceae bacterium]